MTWDVPDWKTAIVWLYIMGWSAYGVEACATFAPEYKDTVRDTTTRPPVGGAVLAVRLPHAAARHHRRDAVRSRRSTIPSASTSPRFQEILGGGADIMVVLLIASLFISMNTATADGSRALYGIARDRVTIKQLDHLNRFHVPGRAMTLDMIINIGLVLFVGNTLAILLAGNLGYMSAHVFALTAFLLLRKDRPQWPRPIRLPSPWVLIAALLCGRQPAVHRRRRPQPEPDGLRRHEGAPDRRGRAAHLRRALPLPPYRAGQGERPPARRCSCAARAGRVAETDLLRGRPRPRSPSAPRPGSAESAHGKSRAQRVRRGARRCGGVGGARGIRRVVRARSPCGTSSSSVRGSRTIPR